MKLTDKYIKLASHTIKWFTNLLNFHFVNDYIERKWIDYLRDYSIDIRYLSLYGNGIHIGLLEYDDIERLQGLLDNLDIKYNNTMGDFIVKDWEKLIPNWQYSIKKIYGNYIVLNNLGEYIQENFLNSLSYGVTVSSNGNIYLELNIKDKGILNSVVEFVENEGFYCEFKRSNDLMVWV